jgi:hypothetical protein
MSRPHQAIVDAVDDLGAGKRARDVQGADPLRYVEDAPPVALASRERFGLIE